MVPGENLGNFLRVHEKVSSFKYVLFFTFLAIDNVFQATFVMHGAARQWELVESLLKERHRK